MTRRKLLIGTILIIAAAAILFFRTYEGKPGAAPSVDEVLEALNAFGREEADAATVLDMVRIDDRQIFVPYVSSQGKYGMGFLEWEKREWSVTRVDPEGRPEVRILDHSDPAERLIVWNMNPLEKMEQISFYLIRDRNGGMSNGAHYYTPRVQMEELVSLTEHPYGALPLPAGWADVIREDAKLNSSRAAGPLDDIFAFMSPRHSMMYIGWLPHYAEDAPPPRGSSKSGGDHTEFIMILNEPDLEKPR